jgi:methionine-rich copper-binding protein CopC
MKLARPVAGPLLLLVSSVAFSHAHLQRASPADGSVIAHAPQSLVLEFSESAQLTALWIAQDGGTRQKITPLPQQAQQRIVVALPALAPGDYRVSWRVVGADGHVVPGQIHFTLSR